MHPSKVLDWNSLLVQIRGSAYDGPEPTTPFWFGDSRQLSSELNALVISGQKTATASLLWEWEFDGDPLPDNGQLDALLDWSNKLVAITRTTKVEVVPFGDVRGTFAALEGEGDLSLDFWRRAHWSYFSKVCEAIGKTPSDEMPVVCEEFELVYLHPRDKPNLSS